MAAWVDDVCAKTPLTPGKRCAPSVSMGEAIEQMAAESFAEGVRVTTETNDVRQAGPGPDGCGGCGATCSATAAMSCSRWPRRVLGSVCQTVVPLVERQIVDGVILDHTSPLWPWLVAARRAGRGARSASPTSAATAAAGWRSAVQYDLRNDMHDHLQAMDFDNLDRMPTGQLVARANSDSTLVQGLLSFFPIMSGNVLLMVVSLGVMIYLSPLLAVVSVVVAPALLVVSYRMRWRVFPATWDGQQREGEVAQMVDEDVNGVRVVKAFGQEHASSSGSPTRRKRCTAPRCGPCGCSRATSRCSRPIPTIGQVAHPGLRRLAGAAARDHPRHLPGLLHLHRPADRARPPAGRRPHIGQQARAGVERIFQLLDLAAGHRRPPGRASSCRRLRGGDRLLRRALRLRPTAHPVLHGLRPAHRRRGAGGHRRAERQRQVHGGHAGLALL